MTAATNGGETREGDETRRIRTISREEAAQVHAGSVATAKNLKFWIGFSIFIAGGGFIAAMYLSQYAPASKLEKTDVAVTDLSRRVDKVTSEQSERIDKVEDHHQDEERRLDNLEKRGDWAHDALLELLTERRLARPPEPVLKKKENP